MPQVEEIAVNQWEHRKQGHKREPIGGKGIVTSDGSEKGSS
jgi:hypothetical protein